MCVSNISYMDNMNSHSMVRNKYQEKKIYSNEKKHMNDNN